MSKEPLDEKILFEVNGIKCGYDGNFVWYTEPDGTEEISGWFEDIKLLETTKHCVVFYSESLEEYLPYDGDLFLGINEIHFDIIPAHHEENQPQLPEMWEQVRPIIDDRDIVNNIDKKRAFSLPDDFHWGIESSCFLAQEEEFYNGKLLIGICACTCQGDSDVIVEIDNSENFVSWKIYYDRNHDRCEILTFNKSEYEKALNDAKSKITRKIEDVHEWSWLLSYSKKELYEKLNK